MNTNMIMSQDMLKIMYANSLSGNKPQSNSETDSNTSSFAELLNGAIAEMKDGNILEENLEETEKSSMNDLLISLLLLIQGGQYQGNSLNYSDIVNGIKENGSIDGISQTTDVDYLLNMLQNSQQNNGMSDSNSLNYLSGLNETDGMSNLIISMLNQNNNSNQTVGQSGNTAKQPSSDATFDNMNFPKSVMDSINSMRAARDQIQSKISSIRDLAGISNVKATSPENSSVKTGNILNVGEIDVILAPQNAQVTNPNALPSIAASAETVNGVNLGLQNDVLINAENSDSIKTVESANVADNKTENSGIVVNGKTVDISSVNSKENMSDNFTDGGFSSTLSEKENDNNLKEKITADNVINEELMSVNGSKDVLGVNKTVKISDDASVLRGSVIEQIKEQIVVMQNNGKQSVTMQLTPENLGKLDIKLIYERGSLSVEILTSNPKAHSLVLSNIAELKSVLQNSLNDRGIMMPEASKEAYEQQRNNQNAGSGQHQAYEENENSKNDVYEETADNDFLEQLLRSSNYAARYI